MTAVIDSDYERHRRELHVHCYRMLGNYQEAEDHVQETFLRAWRSRDGFEGAVRPWLYRIATNACLDTLKARKRQATRASFDDIPWLTPFPDRMMPSGRSRRRSWWRARRSS